MKLTFQQLVVSSDYVQECRNPHTNPSPRTGCQNWAIPGFSWVANKECLQGAPRLFSASDGVCGHCSSAEKDAEEIEQPEEVCFPVLVSVHLDMGIFTSLLLCR